MLEESAPKKSLTPKKKKLIPSLSLVNFPAPTLEDINKMLSKDTEINRGWTIRRR